MRFTAAHSACKQHVSVLKRVKFITVFKRGLAWKKQLEFNLGP